MKKSIKHLVIGTGATVILGVTAYKLVNYLNRRDSKQNLEDELLNRKVEKLKENFNDNIDYVDENDNYIEDFDLDEVCKKHENVGVRKYIKVFNRKQKNNQE